MDKIAMVKTAEVSGVLAALAEVDLIKLAHEDDFDVVVDAVASDLPDNYDIDDVFAKTAEVMEKVYAIYDGEDDGGLAKEAELTETDIMAAYGELSLMKEAGEIDEETFEKEAASLADGLRTLTHGDIGRGPAAVADGVRGIGRYLSGKAESARKGYIKALRGTGKSQAKRSVQEAGRRNAEDLAAREKLLSKREKIKGYKPQSRAAAVLKELQLRDNATSLKQQGANLGRSNSEKAKHVKELSRIRRNQGLAVGGTVGALSAGAYGTKKLYDRFAD